MGFEEVKPQESNFPPTLTLEAGQSVVGIFRGMDSGVQTRYGKQNVYYIEPESAVADDSGVAATGQVALWGSVALDALMGQIRPPARIRIKYEGKENIGEGRTRKVYTVQHDKDWVSEGTRRAGVVVVNSDADIPF